MIDAGRAREFLELAHDRMGVPTLRALAEAAAAKSRHVRRLWREDGGDGALAEVLASVFRARRALRHTGLRAGSGASAAEAVRRLLGDPSPAAGRIDGFCAETSDLLGDASADVAADLLHFSEPERCWLYAGWLWNTADGSGVLPLVGAPLGRAAPSPGEAYLRVGESLAYLRHVLGPAAEELGPDPFGLDVYLAVVYGLYSYMVASVRTTEEFAGILPRPAELAARLLGVRRWLGGAENDVTKSAGIA